MTQIQRNTPNLNDDQRSKLVEAFRVISNNPKRPGSGQMLAMLAALAVVQGFLDRGIHARISIEVMNEFDKPTDEALGVLAGRLADSAEQKEWMNEPYGVKLALEIRMSIQSAALDPQSTADDLLDLVESPIREAVEDEGLSSYDELEAIIGNYPANKEGLVQYLGAVADIFTAAANRAPVAVEKVA